MEKTRKTCGTCHYNNKGYCTAKGESTNKVDCGWHTTKKEFEKQCKRAEIENIADNIRLTRR